MVEKSIREIGQEKQKLRELGIGGTAIGTGINAGKEYKKLVIGFLSKNSGEKFTAGKDAIELTQNMDSFLELSNALSVYAGDLLKICNDLVLLNSGPKTGIGEIVLPAVEPGSSIMPGKVNPSIPEATIMCCIQVLGNDHAIEMGVHRGQLELNVLTPVIAFNLFSSITLLSNASKMLEQKCIKGIKANKQRALNLLEHSAIFATALNPVLGYEKVAEIVKEANKSGKTIKEIVVFEKKLLKEKEFDKIVDLKKLAKEK